MKFPQIHLRVALDVIVESGGFFPCWGDYMNAIQDAFHDGLGLPIGEYLAGRLVVRIDPAHPMRLPVRDGAVVLTTAGWMLWHSLTQRDPSAACGRPSCGVCRPVRCADCGFTAAPEEQGRIKAHLSGEHVLDV